MENKNPLTPMEAKLIENFEKRLLLLEASQTKLKSSLEADSDSALTISTDLRERLRNSDEKVSVLHALLEKLTLRIEAWQKLSEALSKEIAESRRESAKMRTAYEKLALEVAMLRTALNA